MRDLIDILVDRAIAGTRLIGDAGLSMDEVVASIARRIGMMGDITGASEEQRDGAKQVSGAVS